ncbi:MAG TPA: deoxyhypusine synthase family protein [Pyrinomonadaceae bacterium]|nr:deoxyhypusine synthase family protein [Pyrinomonadaceae bacterium]
MNNAVVSAFLKRNFQHFNAATVVEAAEAYLEHSNSGGQMLIALAGAMSTAEIGISLGEMVRRGKIHAICCTGANLEEDLFNLIAHDSYKRVANYRDLTPAQELELFKQDLNRVTDTCIPENEAIRRVEQVILKEWVSSDTAGERLFPHEFLFRALRNGNFTKYYEIDLQDSWLYAAMELDVPIFVPGWEDSTLGNMYAAHCMGGEIKNIHTVKSGVEYLIALASWYSAAINHRAPGFFQIGGGIAGDFAVCVVPMLREDLKRTDVPLWSYYCQISDSTTSYGSYSGAHPNEKITWGKLAVDTPRFVIESDATIVAPLIFALVLGL